MKTIELFRQNVYIKEATASIVDISTEDDGIRVLLDQTIFFPTGGGQSCDLGTIDGINVLNVYEKDKEIFHLLDNADSRAGSLAIGKSVKLAIDWERRFDNMQRHCGEHILSGIFHRLYGGVNRGFHMGDDYMTIDISLEDDPNFSSLDWNMVKTGEYEANKVIWSNAPVTTVHFDTKEDAANMPLRKKLAIENDITIVSVGSIDNPSDCVACCGTHPSTAGQVGMIKAYKLESNKGMFRIYFEAGARAFAKYQTHLDTLETLGQKLSAGPDDILEKYGSKLAKDKEIRNNLYRLNKYVEAEEVAKIASDAENRLMRYDYEDLSLDSLLSIGRKLADSLEHLLVLVHRPTKTVLLFSNGNIDCGKLIRDNASIYNGKGGGNATSARGIFAKDEYVDTFIDLLEKHLR